MFLNPGLRFVRKVAATFLVPPVSALFLLSASLAIPTAHAASLASADLPYGLQISDMGDLRLWRGDIDLLFLGRDRGSGQGERRSLGRTWRIGTEQSRTDARWRAHPARL